MVTLVRDNFIKIGFLVPIGARVKHFIGWQRLSTLSFDWFVAVLQTRRTWVHNLCLADMGLKFLVMQNSMASFTNR